MERKIPPCLYTGLRREFVWGFSDGFSRSLVNKVRTSGGESDTRYVKAPTLTLARTK
jgi:hypothetical protein